MNYSATTSTFLIFFLIFLCIYYNLRMTSLLICFKIFLQVSVFIFTIWWIVNMIIWLIPLTATILTSRQYRVIWLYVIETFSEVQITSDRCYVEVYSLKGWFEVVVLGLLVWRRRIAMWPRFFRICIIMGA